MDRRRLLLPAAVLLAAVMVVLVMLRAGSAPPEQATDLEPGDASGPAASRSDLHEADGGVGTFDYPRTPAGAVAAATAYGLALDGPQVFDASHRRAVLDAIAANGAREELEAAFSEGLDLIGTQLGLDAQALAGPGFVWRVVPGGWQLRDYDLPQARVAIWAAVIAMADDRLLVEPGWRTTEVTLLWEHGGWRLVGFWTEPGPNPSLLAGAGGEPVANQINGFAPYRHWPQQPGPEEGR